MKNRSIFDEAADFAKDRKKEPTQAKKKSLNISSPEARAKEQSELEKDAEAMFREMELMKKDLDHKLKDIYEAGKRHHIDVNAFFSRPNMINPQDIEKFKKAKEELDKFTKSAAETKGQMSTPSKSTDKLAQERKDKTRGMRKKWIPMS